MQWTSQFELISKAIYTSILSNSVCISQSQGKKLLTTEDVRHTTDIRPSQKLNLTLCKPDTPKQPLWQAA